MSESSMYVFVPSSLHPARYKLGPARPEVLRPEATDGTVQWPVRGFWMPVPFRISGGHTSDLKHLDR